MYSDPCRRFVLGVTLAGLSLRLWYSDRSTVITSEEFDINERPDWFVQLIIGIGAAEPELIGWDPTIQRMPYDRSDQNATAIYRIIVHGDKDETRVFETCALLSDVGAEAFIGRGTRVWVVHEVTADGIDTSKVMVLKDCWVNKERELEGNILNDLRAKLADRPELKNFLSVYTHGIVKRRQGDEIEKDMTTSFPEGAIPAADVINVDEVAYFRKGVIPEPPDRQKINSTNERHGRGHVPSIPSRALGLNAFGKPEHLEQRYHYRVVFNEKGEPIQGMTSRKRMFIGIQGAFRGKP
ncbi:hypothetical protein DL93DRAFT_2056122 [Clavulina sp. PMI_390]|nr:hypothetical protein DL93DRAFT_2056122 [Clavulina sp. PMI_390]